MSDEMRVICIPKVILTEELEKRWDLICENAKECQTEGPLEYLQKDDRENWIREKI